MEYKIQNSDTIKEIRDTARLSISEGFPDKLDGKVVPVIDVNPKHARLTNLSKNVSITNSTSGTIFTTDAVKDTYITAASISWIKDVTSTATLFRILYSDENGAVQALLPIAGITLTAGSGGSSISLPNPIKLAKGATISVTSDTAVANFKVSASLLGYTVDPTV